MDVKADALTVASQTLLQKLWQWVLEIPGETIAIVIAALALWVSVQSVRMARKSSETNILLPFQQQYGSSEFESAMRLLDRFEREPNQSLNPDPLPSLQRMAAHRENPEGEEFAAAEKYMRWVRVNGQVAVPVHDARRLINNFYRRAYQLYEAGYLGEKAYAIIADMERIRLLFRVCEPLTLATQFVRIDNSDENAFRQESGRAFEWYDEFWCFCLRYRNRPMPTDLPRANRLCQ